MKNLLAGLALFSSTITLGSNLYDLGSYEITTRNLACNTTPEPCYDTSCQKLILTKGTFFSAVGVENQVDSFRDQPWFFTNFGCYVRASRKYMQSESVSPSELFVSNPPSNVRATPNGPIICVISDPQYIVSYGYGNGWYRTDVCGRIGFIHESQVR